MIATSRKPISTLAQTIASILLGSAIALTATAASHREAPNFTEKPKVDNTDFYMFNSYELGRDGYITLLANYIPAQDPDAIYEVKIDNTGEDAAFGTVPLTDGAPISSMEFDNEFPYLISPLPGSIN